MAEYHLWWASSFHLSCHCSRCWQYTYSYFENLSCCCPRLSLCCLSPLGLACATTDRIFPSNQTTLLESLLAHLETAASNGSATEAPAAEKAAEEPKKDEAAPAEVGLAYVFCFCLQDVDAEQDHVPTQQ